MMNTKALSWLFWMLLICGFTNQLSAQNIKVEEVAPGISKITFGGADPFNPKSFCDEKPDLKALAALPNANLPFQLNQIRVHQNARGLVIEIPLRAKEHLYGFGLQMNSFEQNGLKIRPVVNDNPLNNLGFTHAPLPYYVSTAGYGVLVNTSRYTTFYTGSVNKKAQTAVDSSIAKAAMLTTEELYKNRGSG
ncbi:MAG: glycosyl hydrolase family 31, partial [Sphingobacteriaceae bacterium]